MIPALASSASLARRQMTAMALPVAVLAALAAALLLPGPDLRAAGLALASFGVMAALAWQGIAMGHPHASFGPANAVTLLRAGGVAILCAALPVAPAVAADQATGWMLTALTVMALVSDGVDGRLARQTGMASRFGARFDMEVDAALAAVLCLLAIGMETAGLWLLPLGFLRYLWVAAGFAFGWLARPLPESQVRKAVCVLQISVLILLVSPAAGGADTRLLAGAAAAALAWSFGRDALWLWRRR